ncbi:MAG: 7-cyano-7-deazaguanine synthase [Planctomycetota bacterium]
MKALALLSGGLDSTLAIKVILEQGIEIEALHFTTVFCLCGDSENSCGLHAKNIADEFNIKIKTINYTSSIIESVKKPRYGYGRNMNPCIDCRINMLHCARQRMEETNASFIITGEVLGQRPMSQHLSALKLIEKDTKLDGLILRPLSAKLLEPTIPEKNKWIDREKLLSISGRSRKEQISMANLFEIKDYPCPAGGCLLTDPSFAIRIKDLLFHNPDFTLNDVLLLKIGRHFRLNKYVKLVVGRNEKENQVISNLARPDDLLFEIAEYPGPVSLIRTSSPTSNKFQNDEIKLSGEITARYADINNLSSSPMKARINILSGMPNAFGELDFMENITPLKDYEIDKYRLSGNPKALACL